MSIAPLSAAQLEFLAFAFERPKPFSWIWLQSGGERSFAPGTHYWLAARKMVRGVEVQCRVTVSELDGMAGLWLAPLVELNDAGRALLIGPCIAKITNHLTPPMIKPGERR